MNRDKQGNLNGRCTYESKKIEKTLSENDQVVLELNCQHLLHNYPYPNNYLDLNVEINWNQEEITQNKNYENPWSIQTFENRKQTQEKKERNTNCLEWNEKHYFEDNGRYHDDNIYDYKKERNRPNDIYYNNNDIFYDSTHYFINTNFDKPIHYETEQRISYHDNNNMYKPHNEKGSSASSNESYCSEDSDSPAGNGKNKFMNFSHRITYDDKELLKQLEVGQYNKFNNTIEEESYDETHWSSDHIKTNYERKSKSSYYYDNSNHEYDRQRNSFDNELQISHLEENLPYISYHGKTTDIQPFLIQKLQDIYEDSLEKHSEPFEFTTQAIDSNCRVADEDILNKYEKIVRIMKYLQNLKRKYPQMENVVSLLSKDVQMVAYELHQMFFTISELRHFLKKLYISQIYLLKKVVKKPTYNKENELSTCIIHTSPRNSMRFSSIRPIRERESTKNYHDKHRRNYSMTQPFHSKKSSKSQIRKEFTLLEPIVESWEPKAKNSRNYIELDSVNKYGKDRRKCSEPHRSYQGDINDNMKKDSNKIRSEKERNQKELPDNEEFNIYKKRQSTKNNISRSKEKKLNPYEKNSMQHTHKYSEDTYYELTQTKENEDSYNSHKDTQNDGNIYETEEQTNINRKKQIIENALYKASSRKTSNSNQNDKIAILNEKHLSLMEEQLEKLKQPKEDKRSSQRKLSETQDSGFIKKVSCVNQEKKKLANIKKQEQSNKHCLLKEFNRNNTKNPSKTFMSDKKESMNPEYKKGESNLVNLQRKKDNSNESFQNGKDKNRLIENFEKKYPEHLKEKPKDESEEKKTHVFYVDINKEINKISNRESIIQALKYTLLSKPKNYKNLRNFLFKIEVELVEYKNFVLLITKDIKKPHLEALYGLNDFSVYEKVLGKKKAPRFLVSSKVKFFYKYDIFYKIFRELTYVREFSGITDAVKLI